MKITPVQDNIYKVEIACHTHTCKKIHTFRLDARGCRGYRVDYLGTLGRIWEAIDGGSPVATKAQARALIKQWILDHRRAAAWDIAV